MRNNGTLLAVQAISINLSYKELFFQFESLLVENAGPVVGSEKGSRNYGRTVQQQKKSDRNSEVVKISLNASVYECSKNNQRRLSISLSSTADVGVGRFEENHLRWRIF